MGIGPLVRMGVACHLPAMTIVALASGRGRAGVAVIRISGPAAGSLVEQMAGVVPAPRVAVRAALRDPRNGQVLDDGLVLWFPAPASYTGEDVAELHVHGGAAVLSAVLSALCARQDVRIAEPGEFTRRAFLNGKLDLVQAEAVADLVDAETEEQRRQAVGQLKGRLSAVYDSWRVRLRDALAHLEAVIDFPDEELPEDLISSIRQNLGELLGEQTAHLEDGRRGERLRDGLYVVIAGAPNVGKSSLLNALARRDAAIVSERAGTTRDVVEVRLDLGGLPVIVADTAGLREGRDEIESEGIRRALARAETADLRIVMVEASPAIKPDSRIRSLLDEDAMVVVNKIDLHEVAPGTRVEGRQVWPMSVTAGTGLDSFLDALEKRVERRMGRGESPVITRERHRSSIEETAACLRRFMAGSENGEMTNARLELVAEDLRLAARTLGRVTGKIGVEELLDVVFRDFCIGK
ncbi:MAG: tRNA uridine-5-carboxymethylaminomethyl(34) synthesis GTPase MnmE [Rhodospirillaceae bacterium]|nr:tRNA uridine-5-carboxymethylaminomethyl(34) synthesis GTPase MnmE [Rhodospirillaceae bacterium]